MISQVAPMPYALAEASTLLRGEPELTRPWVEWKVGRAWMLVVFVLLGAGLYGVAMGSWRHPLQSLYTALKFPLVILLTTFGNALLNGMLAPLLGMNIGLRQSLMAVLMSFAIASIVLGAFMPIVLFIVWNTTSSGVHSGAAFAAYSFMQLTHVALISFAGTLGNVRLTPLLRLLCDGNAAVARRVLFAWLAGNLFLGSQICWVLRPFIGRPDMPVEFLGAHPFEGSLYETVFNAFRDLLVQAP
jgi:hypothetical protein